MKDQYHPAIESVDNPSLDVSIILVNWNTREIILQCLDSIRKHTTGISYEIIVVDNGSTDGSVAALQSLSDVHLIANPIGEGFARANNRAMKIAKGRAWLLINQDTILLGNVIKTCTDLLWSDPSIGMVGCKLLNADGSLQHSCAKYPRLLTPLLGRYSLVSHVPGLKNKSPRFARMYSSAEHEKPMFPEWIMGAFMLVRPEAVAQCGPLEERLFLYSEDMEWGYRFWKHGWKVAYTPEMAIIHLGGYSVRKLPEETLRRNIESLSIYLAIHQPAMRRPYLLSEILSVFIEAVLFNTVFRKGGFTSKNVNRSRRLRIKLLWAEVCRSVSLEPRKA